MSKLGKWWYLVPVLLALGFFAWYDESCARISRSTSDSLSCPSRMPFFLPDEVMETSGLIWYDSLLWTINDSGNDALVFGLNPSDGQIVLTTALEGISNTDWEDLALDSSFLYIGDIGNNDGSRRDLCIYRVPLELLGKQQIAEVAIERIRFTYSGQTDYSSHMFQTNWDAEGFIVYRDSVYIFTKDWVEGGSIVYSLPARPGTHPARMLGQIETDGLITGAAYNCTSRIVALCGYSDYQPFIGLLPIDKLVKGGKIPLAIFSCDSIYGVQTEGITFDLQGGLFLSSEASVIPPSLFYYSTQALSAFSK